MPSGRAFRIVIDRVLLTNAVGEITEGVDTRESTGGAAAAVAVVAVVCRICLD
jgi:hypothetical protein